MAYCWQEATFSGLLRVRHHLGFCQERSNGTVWSTGQLKVAGGCAMFCRGQPKGCGRQPFRSQMPGLGKGMEATIDSVADPSMSHLVPAGARCAESSTTHSATTCCQTWRENVEPPPLVTCFGTMAHYKSVGTGTKSIGTRPPQPLGAIPNIFALQLHPHGHDWIQIATAPKPPSRANCSRPSPLPCANRLLACPHALSTGAAASQCVTPRGVRQFGGLWGGGGTPPPSEGGGGTPPPFVDPNPAPFPSGPVQARKHTKLTRRKVAT